jgi:hypothetical protein
MEGTYSPVASRRKARLQLVPPIARTDQLARSNGLVCCVQDPHLVASILEYRGYLVKNRRGVQVARLRNLGGCVVAVFVSGLLIALAPDSSSVLELMATIWPYVQREEV